MLQSCRRQRKPRLKTDRHLSANKMMCCDRADRSICRSFRHTQESRLQRDAKRVPLRSSCSSVTVYRTVLHLLGSLEQHICTLSDTSMHKTTGSPLPVLLTRADTWYLRLCGLWAPATLRSWLMSVSGSIFMTEPHFLLFQTSECGDCCSLIIHPTGLLDRFGVKDWQGHTLLYCRCLLTYNCFFTTDLNTIC